MKNYQYILTLLIIAFASGNIYAQHLFSVNYGDLSQDNANMIRTEVARLNTSVSTMSMTRNRENKEVYAFSLSAVQNTKIVILNEETGKSVVITPVEEAPAQFELAPFFIEELRQAALGDADRYLVVETGADFSVRNATSVSAASREVFIPRYFYGSKENIKEAFPKDREIIHIFKEKPRLIPAFPDDPENLRYVAHLEEEMSYYVYMYKFPDGTLCIYDEHFNPSAEKNEVSTRGGTKTCCSYLQFNLSDTLNATQRKATEYALGLWSKQLLGTVPVDIQVTFTNMGMGFIGYSYSQPNFLDTGTHTWYSSAQWNQIVGQDVTTQSDIRIEMNTQFSFYFGLDGNTLGYDYVTILLHEVTHGLGFASLIYWDGTGNTTQNNGRFVYSIGDNQGAFTNYPGIFDRQLYQGAIGNTCLTDLNQTDRAALVTSGNLYAGRPGSNLLAANGGSRVKMFAPSSWVKGSSVSHWDNNSGFTNFMQYSYQYPLHTFNARKIGIMRDMGWKIPCPPIVNFIGTVSTPIIVTSDTIIESCGDINVQNVKVQNGAKLILDAAGEVNIISDFDVDLGSEFEIK